MFQFFFLLFLFYKYVSCEFVYSSFEDLSALDFVGDATTTSCVEGIDPRLSYVSKHGSNDANIQIEEETMTADTRLIGTESRVMDNYTESKQRDITKNQAGFGHRTEYEASPKTPCPVRIRLTPSEPSKKGTSF